MAAVAVVLLGSGGSGGGGGGGSGRFFPSKPYAFQAIYPASADGDKFTFKQ